MFHLYNGSETTADRIVSRVSAFVRRTLMVASADLEKTPSVPEGPMPSTTSRVSLKGTVSGVVKVYR